MSKVKIVHRKWGELEVTPRFAEVALKANHIEGGGSYCAVKEVPRYFQSTDNDGNYVIETKSKPVSEETEKLLQLIDSLPAEVREKLLNGDFPQAEATTTTNKKPAKAAGPTATKQASKPSAKKTSTRRKKTTTNKSSK